jgi:hypothetical protein
MVPTLLGDKSLEIKLIGLENTTNEKGCELDYTASSCLLCLDVEFQGSKATAS